MTEAQYLALEEKSEVRHEYLDGQIRAMPGTTRNHNQIVGNLRRILEDSIRENPCEVATESIKVHVPGSKAYFYPDVAQSCDPSDNDPRLIRLPVLIAEVLSDSSFIRDTTIKLDAYLSIPSLRYYLLVYQDAPIIHLFYRVGEGWLSRRFKGLEAVVPLPEIRAELPLTHIYQRITLAEGAVEKYESEIFTE